ncbi:MAG TPA: MFS transporter [Vicinamibacterales bacterium]|nr:MFS transporter [Vicinamibacterales bacterium]
MIGNQTIDVGELLDRSPWSAYQKLLVAATATTIILDGLDNQLIGAAVPAMMREWSLPRSAFVPLQTAGMLGMMIGGAIGGVVGDRLGRRVALLGSVITFGALTVLVALSNGVALLTLLRFLAGFGLGGAMPNAAALSSEYVPIKKRPFAVTLTIVCIPLGGSLAGIVGGLLLPTFGWRGLFMVGGILPLAIAAVLVKVLPESPRFLARTPTRWPQLRTLLRRLGHQVPNDAQFAESGDRKIVRVATTELMTPEFRGDTIALCASFLFCLLTVYIGTNWVPTMLSGAGFDVGTASYGLTAFNLGGVVGAIVGAIVIMRLGSRLTMLVMAAGAIAGAVVLASISIGPQSTFLVLAMLAWTGGLINAVQTTMYALAAHVYPTAVRATGVGTAVSIGRFGGVLSPSVGSWALEAGPARYFGLMAATMTVALAALAAVRRHIPGAVAAPQRHAVSR